MVATNNGYHAMCAALEFAGAFPCATALSPGEWWAVLEKLTPREQRVVILIVLRDLTQRDVAERLGVSRGRVYGLWVRALAKLRGSKAIRELSPERSAS